MLLKRFIQFAVGIGVILISATRANATPIYQLMGPNLTAGEVSSGWSVISDVTNPAAAAAAREPEESRYRFGLFSSVGGSIEFGAVDDIVEDIDDLVDDLEKDAVSFTEGQRIQRDSDRLLRRLERDGYFKFSYGYELPVMPIVIAPSGFGGAFSIDASTAALGRAGILTDNARPTIYNPTTQEIETSSALYLKSAEQTELSFGYSTEMPYFGFERGHLYAGARLRYIQMRMSKGLFSLQELIDDGVVDDGDDAREYISDRFGEDLEDQSAFALDFGLLWLAENHRIGMTLMNLNTPEFDYPTIGRGCSGMTGDDQSSCLYALQYANDIALAETHTMNAQGKLDAVFYSVSRHWLLGVAYDLNEARDPTGDEIQRFSMSGGYHSLGFGARLGYRKNLAGSGLSEWLLGFSFVRMVNFDLSWGRESVDFDGTSVPRTFGLNLGLELPF